MARAYTAWVIREEKKSDAFYAASGGTGHWTKRLRDALQFQRRADAVNFLAVHGPLYGGGGVPSEVIVNN